MCSPHEYDHLVEKRGSRKGLGHSANDHHGQIFQQKRGADGGNEERDARGIAQWFVGGAVKENPHQTRYQYRQREADIPGKGKERDGIDRHIGRKHQQIAVSEIDQPQDAIDHGVANGHQTIQTAQRNPIDQLLEKNRRDPHSPRSQSLSNPISSGTSTDPPISVQHPSF